MKSWSIPRWIRLAMPEDVAQIEQLVAWQYGTATHRRAALRYELAELRRLQWDRHPRKPTRRPALLRPSRIVRSTGYRTDAARHRVARLQMAPDRRQDIARQGAQTRWTT